MILLLWLLFCFLVAAMGSGRKIGFFLSFLLSLFLSPLVGLIFVLLSKRNSEIAQELQMEALKAKQDELMRLQKGIEEPKSRADLLRDLVKIKDEGLITEVEFQERKNNILSK